MELIKDYECTIAYHPKKDNGVADVLSRRNPNPSNKGRIVVLKVLKDFKAVLNARTVGNLMARFQMKSTLKEEIVQSQLEDPELRKIAEDVRCER